MYTIVKSIWQIMQIPIVRLLETLSCQVSNVDTSSAQRVDCELLMIFHSLLVSISPFTINNSRQAERARGVGRSSSTAIFTVRCHSTGFNSEASIDISRQCLSAVLLCVSRYWGIFSLACQFYESSVRCIRRRERDLTRWQSAPLAEMENSLENLNGFSVSFSMLLEPLLVPICFLVWSDRVTQSRHEFVLVPQSGQLGNK